MSESPWIAYFSSSVAGRWDDESPCQNRLPFLVRLQGNGQFPLHCMLVNQSVSPTFPHPFLDLPRKSTCALRWRIPGFVGEDDELTSNMVEVLHHPTKRGRKWSYRTRHLGYPTCIVSRVLQPLLGPHKLPAIPLSAILAWGVASRSCWRDRPWTWPAICRSDPGPHGRP